MSFPLYCNEDVLRCGNMNNQYHHYIPQFILRNFAIDVHRAKHSEKRAIKVYFISKNKTMIRNIRRCYGITNMYKDVNNKDDSMFIEKNLCKLEASVSKIIHRMKESVEQFTINKVELDELTRFLFIMYYRKNVQYSQYLAGNFDVNAKSDIEVYMKRKGFASYNDVWLYNINQVLIAEKNNEALFIDKMYSLARKQYFMIRKSTMYIWKAEPGSEFILTDNSFGIYDGFYPSVNFHAFYVISPSIVVVMYDSTSNGLLPLPKSSNKSMKCKNNNKLIYNITTIPKIMVNLINLIALNEACESITYNNEQYLLKCLKLYESTIYPRKNDYKELKDELIHYVNRTHS